MILVDEACLARFRQPGICEWCRRPCFQGRDPHHIMSRGAGRVDFSWNLCGICRLCHVANHQGNEPTRLDLMAVAARREGILQDDIIRLVHAVRRTPKEQFTMELVRQIEREAKGRRNGHR